MTLPLIRRHPFFVQAQKNRLLAAGGGQRRKHEHEFRKHSTRHLDGIA